MRYIIIMMHENQQTHIEFVLSVIFFFMAKPSFSFHSKFSRIYNQC